MPWCDMCAEYLAPNATTSHGACPKCNTVLATKSSLQMEARSLGLPGPGQSEGEVAKAPWHFKLLLLAVVLYLGWRGVQGIGWLFEKFS